MAEAVKDSTTSNDMNENEETTETPTSDKSSEALSVKQTDGKQITNINLALITDGKNERGIPEVKFIEDITAFANSFSSETTCSAEVLIGAFTDLFTKYKAYESSLTQKRLSLQQKTPEIEKSLNLIKHLKKKQEEEENVVTMYELADTIYAKADINCSDGIVNLWLGANVMLEYTYDEAIELLTVKHKAANREYEEAIQDLAFTRNQIITSEVNISRIYNWDVRSKRTATSG